MTTGHGIAFFGCIDLSCSPEKIFLRHSMGSSFPGDRSSSVQSISISCLQKFVLNENKNFGQVFPLECRHRICGSRRDKLFEDSLAVDLPVPGKHGTVSWVLYCAHPPRCLSWQCLISMDQYFQFFHELPPERLCLFVMKEWIKNCLLTPVPPTPHPTFYLRRSKFP